MTEQKFPVVILCGGKGTRLREQTEFVPKPMVLIGKRPILWHIMKFYSHFGFNDFILCLGYKGEEIKKYFLNYNLFNNDYSFNNKSKKTQILTTTTDEENWNITFVDTGQETMTGGRIKRIEPFVKADHFLCTYGDGVSDIDLPSLVQFHLDKGKTATLTGVHPSSPFGIVEAENGIATSFKEKPRLEDTVNGGFFVFSKKIFDYLPNDGCVLEVEPLQTLTKEQELAVYEHPGSWLYMDTQKDVNSLNALWSAPNPPWKVWK